MYESSYKTIPVSMNESVFTVKRGEICKRNQELWPEIKTISDKCDVDELKNFVRNLKVSDDFSGVLHRNCFKVNRPIGITKIGFFGPDEVDIAEYNVSIEIEFLRNYRNRHQTLMVANYFSIQAQKQNIFYIQLEKLFVIEPNNFYNVCFQLDGPRTGICDPTTLKNECIYFAGDTQLEFSFLRGSLQMPEIQFILL